MKRSEEKAKEWMEEQESSPRPGSLGTKTYIPKGVTLNPIVKMVKPESLKPNPRNDFDRLSEEEYASLKENIALNGILDALTARKDGTLVTGENRYRIALELKEHEDESVRRRVENIPVRYYMNELTPEEEYDILEGDNLFRRHLTSEQRKERLKRRILRKYKDDLVLDNRGGDRKSEALKEEGEEKSNDEGHRMIENLRVEGNLFLETEGSKIHPLALKQGSNEKSKDQGDLLIGNSSKDLAKKISENENIPFGSAKRYVTELKKELKSKDSKPAKKKTSKQQKASKPKDKVGEFQRKYSKMNAISKKTEVNRLVSKLVDIRKKRKRLEEESAKLMKEDFEIVGKLESVGEKKRVQGI
ncbi:chromosome partitioning protein ParB [Leptospira interrogans]|uniref:ParB N-terminal domain-containing protein n=1 Tax=Leptospira interrogans TaxID=173 RepID=UPI0010C04B20|nr:ParB N-terminal domain-containing protein [Leptospira interrogans]QCO32050.1 chromosome partitioning protein ParB [Leptospira interrogans]